MIGTHLKDIIAIINSNQLYRLFKEIYKHINFSNQV